MNYLTTSEMSNKWNISSRMVAYYCETGRIIGAVKKGKNWFIPIGTEKPRDNRYAKQKVEISDNKSEKYDNFSELDVKNIDKIYHINEVYNNLGLTRETLRYYEEIGLIKPKREKSNQYREFGYYDMAHLMAIDFYKKRGFTATEIKQMLKVTEVEEYNQIIQYQINNLQAVINCKKEMLKKLKDTKGFLDSASKNIGMFTIKNFPLYSVQSSMPSVESFAEYKNKIFSILDKENEDILSNIVRAITFDENGYKNSEMLIVQPPSKINKENNGVFLEDGKCLYTTFMADNNDSSILDKMFALSHEWSKKHNLSFRGVVYIFIRFVIIHEKIDKNFYEVWIPLK